MDMNLINRIPGALQGVVDAGDLSGFVTLIWRKGEIVQLNTLGRRDIAGDKPMTRDTMFRIASMTKPLTSVLALMLMEEGQLKLDDPITKWAPEFSGMKVLKSASGPLDEVVDAPRDITVEDLLTHRSGLAYGFTSVGPIAHAHQEVLGPPLGNPHGPDQWMDRLASLPLSYAPGERFHYSHATDVLGFLVGRVAGATYQDFLKAKILEPLGMTDTDFWCPPEKRDRMAKLYKAEDDAPLKDVSFVHEDHPPAFCAGGGGLISTVDDYLTFARLMLNRGELNGVRLIREDTFDLMTSNRLTPEQRAIPFMGIPFWLGQGFGLGVSVITDPEKQAWMGAGSTGAFGWPGAFGTWWQADPEEDMILIYLIQNSMELGPESASQVATGQRMGGRAALPIFQKQAYAALGKGPALV
ncbi:serine hydrolase [Phenylobacterium sp.]|uniref:serine hydrolase domain-containing protein n=1 Tax=Phenylobacterium sp. TaxID=1871053 RepID=UPI0025D3C486|nr:serine hydrolase domain-containing protein [Phenylobacterium sp.]MCA6326652.1 beta-lactamase family protein [Phenylobacterium sp.]